MSEVAALIDVINTSSRWLADGKRVVLARVVAVAGSAPRPPGATMAISDDGEVAGSLTGGCVEASVVDAASRVLTNRGSQIMDFDYGDEVAFEMGLTCGGNVRVLLAETTFPPVAVNALEAGDAFAMATPADGSTEHAIFVSADGDTTGTLGDSGIDHLATTRALEVLASGDPWRNGLFDLPGPSGEMSVFVEAHHPRPILVIVGSVDVTTAALVRLAGLVGFHTIVCDPRATFTTEQRLAGADEIVVERPEKLIGRLGARLGPSDAVCVLTHRMSFDVPAVLAALHTEVGYVGALGSRRTAELRVEQLVDEGATDADLERLHAPIGLDIGATTPDEIALAVLAEIIANRTGASGGPLHRGTGPLHTRLAR